MELKDGQGREKVRERIINDMRKEINNLTRVLNSIPEATQRQTIIREIREDYDAMSSRMRARRQGQSLLADLRRAESDFRRDFPEFADKNLEYSEDLEREIGGKIESLRDKIDMLNSADFEEKDDDPESMEDYWDDRDIERDNGDDSEPMEYDRDDRDDESNDGNESESTKDYENYWDDEDGESSAGDESEPMEDNWDDRDGENEFDDEQSGQDDLEGDDISRESDDSKSGTNDDTDNFEQVEQFVKEGNTLESSEPNGGNEDSGDKEEQQNSEQEGNPSAEMSKDESEEASKEEIKEPSNDLFEDLTEKIHEKLGDEIETRLIDKIAEDLQKKTEEDMKKRTEKMLEESNKPSPPPSPNQEDKKEGGDKSEKKEEPKKPTRQVDMDASLWNEREAEASIMERSIARENAIFMDEMGSRGLINNGGWGGGFGGGGSTSCRVQDNIMTCVLQDLP